MSKRMFKIEPCKIDGCIKNIDSRGLCSMHYYRLMKNGSPSVIRQSDLKGAKCMSSNCDNAARKRFLCNSHYTKLWRTEKPELAHKNIQQSWRNRTTRKRGAEGSHTRQQWEELLNKYGGLCSYCLINKATDKDHIIPLVKGGTDYIDNIAPACDSCNSKKWSLDLPVFLDRLKKRELRHA